MKIKRNSLVLFQGDSVTDCHRDRLDFNSLGDSYVKIINEVLKEYNIQILNRAISGNRVDNLLERFDKDFKELNPDYLFLLIGVNDTWHNYPNCKNNEVFYQEYDLLLSRIKNEMNCEVVILEPFIIGSIEEITCMRGDLLKKVEIIRKLAKKYQCELITFENRFAEAMVNDDESLYSIEGIHPKELGYHLMAKTILSKIEII